MRICYGFEFQQDAEPDEQLLSLADDDADSEDEAANDKRINLQNIEEEEDADHGLFPDTNIDLHFVKGGR